MIRAIVAVDKKWGIGRKNGLLFSLPADMQFFKEKTLNTTVCMGYNTLLSFPNSKPLKLRKNIVICPDGVDIEGAVCVHNLDDMRSVLSDEKGDVYVIGGAFFYKSMLEYCDEILVTKVDADGNAEVFFENLDNRQDFKCVFESGETETNGYKIKFTTYKNLSKKPL